MCFSCGNFSPSYHNAAMGSSPCRLFCHHGCCHIMRAGIAPRMVADEGTSRPRKPCIPSRLHVPFFTDLPALCSALLQHGAAHRRHRPLHPSLHNPLRCLHLNAAHHSYRLGLHAFLLMGSTRALVARCPPPPVPLPHNRQLCLGVNVPFSRKTLLPLCREH